MGLHVRDPAYACTCIVACVILHNIATKNRDYIETEKGRQLDNITVNDDPDQEAAEQSDWQNTNAGRIFRNAIVGKYF